MSGTLTPINEMSRQPIVFSQRSVDDDDDDDDDDDADEGRRSIVTCFPGTKAKSRKHDTTIEKQRMSWIEVLWYFAGVGVSMRSDATMPEPHLMIEIKSKKSLDIDSGARMGPKNFGIWALVNVCRALAWYGT